MKIKISLTFTLTLLSSLTYSQWNTYSENDPFRGEVRYACVSGNGGKYPYNKPSFCVSYTKGESALNFYISDAGYSGCRNKSVYLKFDKDDIIYEAKSVSSGTNNDSWFIKTGYDNSRSSQDGFLKNNDSLIYKLQKHNFFYSRLASSCNVYEYRFSLNGSTSAISFVQELYTKSLPIIKEKRKKKRENEMELYQKEKDKLNALIRKGDSLKKIEIQRRYGDLIDRFPTSEYDYLTTKFSYTRLYSDSALTNGIKTISTKGTLVITRKSENYPSKKHMKDKYKTIFIQGIGEVTLYLLKDYLK